jgi:unsaturated rhamnogalacturonyl hydrolase
VSPEFPARLARYGGHVPRFITRYLARWKPYRAHWNYEDGCIFLGCLELADATGEGTLREFAYRAVTSHVSPQGVIAGYDPEEFNIDNINPGKALVALFAQTGERRFRLAIDQQLAQLQRHPRTQSGNYWHKKIYPWQVWLDGLYMAQPFQLACAHLVAQPALVEDSLRQFANVRATMRDPGSGLYFHGWDESRLERWSNPRTGCSENFWGRAMGWFMMALVDCLDVLMRARGAHGPQTEPLAGMLTDAVRALLRVRSPRGLWYQVLDEAGRERNYEEASASLMIAYALMKGARLGVLSADTGRLGAESLRACIATFLSEHALEGICGVAGLGNQPYRDGSYHYYVSEPVVANDPKGVAALFLALAESERYPAA